MFFLLISTLTGSNLRYKSIVNRSFHIRFSHYIPAASTLSTQKKRKSVNICTLYFTQNVNFCTLHFIKNVNFCTLHFIKNVIFCILLKPKSVNFCTTFMYFTKIARFTITAHSADL